MVVAWSDNIPTAVNALHNDGRRSEVMFPTMPYFGVAGVWVLSLPLVSLLDDSSLVLDCPQNLHFTDFPRPEWMVRHTCPRGDLHLLAMSCLS